MQTNDNDTIVTLTRVGEQPFGKNNPVETVEDFLY